MDQWGQIDDCGGSEVSKIKKKKNWLSNILTESFVPNMCICENLKLEIIKDNLLFLKCLKIIAGTLFLKFIYYYYLAEILI